MQTTSTTTPAALTSTLRLVSASDTRDALGIPLEPGALYRAPVPPDVFKGPIQIGDVTLSLELGDVPNAREMPALAFRAIRATLPSFGAVETAADAPDALELARAIESTFPKVPEALLANGPHVGYRELAAQVFARGCRLPDDAAAAAVGRLAGVGADEAARLVAAARASGYIEAGVYLDATRKARREAAAERERIAAEAAAEEMRRKTRKPVDLVASVIAVIEVDEGLDNLDVPAGYLRDLVRYERDRRHGFGSIAGITIVFRGSGLPVFPEMIGMELAALLRFGWAAFDLAPGVHVLASDDSSVRLSPDEIAAGRGVPADFVAMILRRRRGTFDAGPIDPASFVDESGVTGRGRRALARKMKAIETMCPYALPGEGTPALRMLAEILVREAPPIDPEVACAGLMRLAVDRAPRIDRPFRSFAEREERARDVAAWIAAGPKYTPAWTEAGIARVLAQACNGGVYTGPKGTAPEEDDDAPGLVDRVLGFVGLGPKEDEPSAAFLNGVAAAVHGRDKIRGEEIWNHLESLGVVVPCAAGRKPVEAAMLVKTAWRLGFVKKNAIGDDGLRSKHFVRVAAEA